MRSRDRDGPESELERAYKAKRPTAEEVRTMPLEDLRAAFDAGAFGLMTTWEQVLLMREGK